MPMPPPATEGMPLADVDTPALVIDLDAFERNLERMAAAAAKAGVRLRPHAKTHKSPHIALLQMKLGAVGVCCQKVSEAEVLVDGGVGDVYVSNEVIGGRKLERLARLAHRATISIAADHADAIDALSAAAIREGVTLRVLVEIDVGGGRCGVDAGRPAALLAQRIIAAPGLEFAGLQAYHGRAQHLRTIEERRRAVGQAIANAEATVASLDELGIACPLVTGAGTGTFEIEAGSGVYGELQAGSYCFMDADYARNLDSEGAPVSRFEHALFVYATVMSVPTDTRAILDAGLKSLAFDSGVPTVVGLSGACYERPSDEHGTLDVSACNAKPRLGDKVLLVPGHCDPTVNLHDWYVGVRGMSGPTPTVECVWPVAARGAIF